MHPVELSQLLAIVEALGPRRCLEWGSGGSTRALLERCPFIEQYVSIEHDARWHAEVAKSVHDPRLSLHLVLPDLPVPPPNAPKAAVTEWDDRAEVDPERMRSYVGFARSLGQRFDFVLVDGRARCFCLREGFDLLRPGGVIVLHDAQRQEYHRAVAELGRATFLEPWYQGQICLVKKP